MSGRQAIGRGAAMSTAGSLAAGSSSMGEPIGSPINGNRPELSGALCRVTGSAEAHYPVCEAARTTTQLFSRMLGNRIPGVTQGSYMQPLESGLLFGIGPC